MCDCDLKHCERCTDLDQFLSRPHKQRAFQRRMFAVMTQVVNIFMSLNEILVEIGPTT